MSIFAFIAGPIFVSIIGQNSDPPADGSPYIGFGWGPWFSYVGLIISSTTGLFGMILTAQRLRFAQSRQQKIIGKLIMLLFLVLCAAAMVSCCVFLIRAPLTPVGNGPKFANEFQIFMGTFLTIVLLPLCILWVAFMIKGETSQRFVGQLANNSIRPNLKSDLKPLLELLGVYVICIIACLIFPPIWNFSFFSYWPVGSPYSLIHSPHIKLFLDILVYYCFILFVIFMGILTNISSTIRRLVNKRVWSPSSINVWKWNPHPTGITLGECLLLFAFFALYGFWVYFWCIDYARIANQFLPERIARTFGHLTALPAGFLMVPATHHSLWESVFGIPVDRAVKYEFSLNFLRIFQVPSIFGSIVVFFLDLPYDHVVYILGDHWWRVVSVE